MDGKISHPLQESNSWDMIPFVKRSSSSKIVRETPAPGGTPAAAPAAAPAPGAGAGAGAQLAGALVEPLAALALREGVQLPALIDALKVALVREAVGAPTAPRLPGASAGGITDSRIAVMTGVHRKDVRRIRAQGRPAAPRGASLAMQVFARWRSDPRYLTARGAPRQLPRQASAGEAPVPSFESLVLAVTRDVHPRTVLDELLRLGIVESRPGDRVRLTQTAFVPAADDRAMVSLAVANLGDHAAAVGANLARTGPRFLEQAIFSDGLSAESARIFNRRSLLAWEQVFETMMPLARTLFEADRAAGGERTHRVRLGMYSWIGRHGAGESSPVDEGTTRRAEGADT